MAVNTVIQGSAADMIKMAMISIHRRLRDEGLAAKMLLQIHDELVFEFSPETQRALQELVENEMIRVMPLRVPLKVDIKVGRNWAECDPV
jgi:DNA polymerase-1